MFNSAASWRETETGPWEITGSNNFGMLLKNETEPGGRVDYLTAGWPTRRFPSKINRSEKQLRGESPADGAERPGTWRWVG